MDEARLERDRSNLRERLTRILSLMPHQPDGIRLRKRSGELMDNLFLFLEDVTIPPTNNSSEQAIRMSVIFRHVTNCFRSEWGRDLFVAVRSVCQEIIPIEGKSLRGSDDREKSLKNLHLVTAWASKQRLVLGQVKRDRISFH